MNTQLKKKSLLPPIQSKCVITCKAWTEQAGVSKNLDWLLHSWCLLGAFTLHCLIGVVVACCVGLFCRRIPPQLSLSWEFESSLVLHLDQLLAGLLLLQINALLAHTYAHHLHIAHGCFPVTAGWEAGQRPFGLKSLKYSLSGPLQRKSADPCLLENQLMHVFYIWLLFNRYCFYLSLYNTWFVFLVKN